MDLIVQCWDQVAANRPQIGEILEKIASLKKAFAERQQVQWTPSSPDNGVAHPLDSNQGISPKFYIKGVIK